MSGSVGCVLAVVDGGQQPEPGVDLAGELAAWRARALAAEERAQRAEAQVVELSGQVDALSEKVAVLARMLFGTSSEKADGAPDAGGGAEPAGGQGGPAPAGSPPPRRRRGQQPGAPGHGRRDYTDLPAREEVHDVDAQVRCCPRCGRAMTPWGSTCSEQIDWEVRLVRIVHRRMRYRRGCECPVGLAGPQVITAAGPALLPGVRLFTASFLARLAWRKYAAATPVHRIAAELAADGLGVAEGSLTGALQALAPLLAPWAGAITAHLRTASRVHADETTWRIFTTPEVHDGQEGGAGTSTAKTASKAKASTRSWLWVFTSPDAVVFRMSPTRAGTVAADVLGLEPADQQGKGRGPAWQVPPGRQLVISSDFYIVYQVLGQLAEITNLWCWAHMRRYFIRAGDAHPDLRPWTAAWVARIGDLYLAHRALARARTAPQGDDHDTDAAACARAQAQAAFDAALAEIDTARHTQMAAAELLHPAAVKVLATLNAEWDGLAAHRDFPDEELDNNVAERALRTPVLGRKNYWGHHARWSAELAADLWTITATLQRDGIDPLGALTAYLNECARTCGPLTGPALAPFLPWTHTDTARDTARDTVADVA